MRPNYTAARARVAGIARRRVVNDGRALQLEVSKVAQYAALAQYGIRTPRTSRRSAARTSSPRRARCRRRSSPSTTAPARAWASAFSRAPRRWRIISQRGIRGSVDGITLIQEYIRSPEPLITRVEFVGGRFLYAVGSTRRSGSSCARPTSARSATRSARSAKMRQCRGAPRRASASSTASSPDRRALPEIPRRPTASASPASSSSPMRAARSTPTTSTRTPITTAMPRPRPDIYGMRAIAAYLGTRAAPAARRRRDERAGRRLRRCGRRLPANRAFTPRRTRVSASSAAVRPPRAPQESSASGWQDSSDPGPGFLRRCR